MEPSGMVEEKDKVKTEKNELEEKLEALKKTLVQKGLNDAEILNRRPKRRVSSLWSSPTKCCISFRRRRNRSPLCRCRFRNSTPSGNSGASI